MSTIALLYPQVYELARFREHRKEFPPFGVLYLAAAAEAAGHTVALRSVAPGDTSLDLRTFDVVGFSLASSATYGTMLAARRSARMAPGAVTLVGGVHANFYPRATAVDFDVDAVSCNGTEETFLALLERAGDPARLAEVPGTWTAGADGSPTPPARTPVTKKGHIDTLPLPARHLLPEQDVVMTDRLAGTDLRMAHLMLSRGCPFPCRFCAAAKQIFQWRTGASAREELLHLVGRYAIDGFAVVDDNFIIRRDVVEDVCSSIADLGLRWSALSRVDRVDERLLEQMRAAGCIELKFGVESGSERMLEAMGKGGGASPDTIRHAVRASARAGIGVKAFVIHGFPGEDDASTDETIALLDELRDDIERVSVFRFVPLPGTEVFANPGRYGLRGVDAAGPADGRWERFHIHHNDEHWWGTQEQFAELTAAHGRLAAFVAERWPEPLAAAT